MKKELGYLLCFIGIVLQFILINRITGFVIGLEEGFDLFSLIGLVFIIGGCGLVLTGRAIIESELEKKAKKEDIIEVVDGSIIFRDYSGEIGGGKIDYETALGLYQNAIKSFSPREKKEFRRLISDTLNELYSLRNQATKKSQLKAKSETPQFYADKMLRAIDPEYQEWARERKIEGVNLPSTYDVVFGDTTRTYGRGMSKNEYKTTMTTRKLSSRSNETPVFDAPPHLIKRVQEMSKDERKDFLAKIGVVSGTEVIFFKTNQNPIIADAVRQKNGLQQYRFPKGTEIQVID